MLQAALDKGVTPENVAVMEKLMDLYERDQARQAEKEFARAFAALQADMPKIQAVRAVPNNDGSIRYKFAPYEEIMAIAQPFLIKHGFAPSFNQSFIEGRVVEACTLQHIGGHSRTNSYGVRVGSGPPKASEAQADGAASTYAKRHALCNALNIVIDHDTDGRSAVNAEGSPLSRDQIQYLREQVAATGSDEAKFLALAGAKTYEEIMSGSYDVMVRFLSMKGRR